MYQQMTYYKGIGPNKMYDIYYIGENKSLKENYPFAKQVSNEQNINSKTSMYWLIEPNTEITDIEVLD